MTALGPILDAIEASLAPLVGDDPAMFRKVLQGISEKVNEFPIAEVRFGPATIGRDPAQRILERRATIAGVVRIYQTRSGNLETEVNAFVPVIDAVQACFALVPTLDGLVDRFDCSGWTGPPALDAELKALFVDVGWIVTDAEADTYVQDW